ncbi:MAG: AI-2E family transporter [Myxococcaceae bacterium]|nr:AI-2E family transporter [Myxococcaceae bacterium]
MATTRSQVSARTVWTVGLNVLALLALWQAVGRLRAVTMLVLLALLVALALDSPVRWLERHGLRRGWGVLGVSLGLLGLFALMVGSLIPMLVDQVQRLLKAAPGLVARLAETEWLRSVDERVGLVAAARRMLEGAPGAVAGSLLDVLSSTVGLLVAGITLFVLVVFMLLFGGDLTTQSLELVSTDRRAQVARVLGHMRKAVGGYLAGAVLTVTVGALVTTTLTFLLGVPYFLALGLSYLLLGFIPYAGSAIVALLVSLTTLATVGLKRALIALGIFLVYQQVEGNLLQPLIQRRTIRMNPLLITLVLLVGAGVWGVLGVIVALPVAAALQVVLREVQRERGLGKGAPTRGGEAPSPPAGGVSRRTDAPSP